MSHTTSAASLSPATASPASEVAPPLSGVDAVIAINDFAARWDDGAKLASASGCREAAEEAKLLAARMKGHDAAGLLGDVAWLRKRAQRLEGGAS